MTHLISPQVPHAASDIREHTPVIYSMPSSATIPPKTDRVFDIGKPLGDSPSSSLALLPAEIISCIAQHVRPMAGNVEDYMPRVPRVCLCLPDTPMRRAEAQVMSHGCYQGSALELSMTCKRMREIIFDGQSGRRVSIGLCDVAAGETRGISEALRSHVRVLHLQSDSTHTLPTLVIQLNNLRFFPSLVALELDWKLWISGTPMSLLPSYLIDSTLLVDNQLRELLLVLHQPSSHRTEPRPTTKGILSEMKGILNHLILPNLQSLIIELHLDATVNHDRSDWGLISAKIQSIKRFRDLRKVQLRLEITVDKVLNVDHWTMVTRLCTAVLKKTRVTELRVTITFFLVPTDRVRYIVFGNGSERDISRCPLWPTPGRMDTIVDTVAAAHPALLLFSFQVSGKTGSVWQEGSEMFARATYCTDRPTDSAASGSKAWIEVESNEQGVIDIYEEMKKNIAEFAEGEEEREWMAMRRFVD